MTLIVPWLAFPIVLGVLCFGCGLLVEQLAGARLPSALLVPVGLAAIVVASSFTVAWSATAPLTTPLVAAFAAAGFVVARGRRLDGWAAAASVLVYLCYGAPVLASGAATFAGYVKLDDTATFLAFTDRVLEHGRSLHGLPPSSYEATLSVNIAHGYPLGSVLPLGIGQELVRTDPAWLYQPWLAFCAACLALCLYQLSAALSASPPLRSLVAVAAAQPALLYGYALWGGVKELAGAALVATAASLTGGLIAARGVRSLLPFLLACAAVLDALSAAAAVWLVPLVLALVPLLRRSRTTVATGLAGMALLALPALAGAGAFLRPSNRSVFEDDVELGNLIRPLRPLQILGIWPSGDFRVDPHARHIAAVLIALAVAAVLVGVLFAIKLRAFALLLALGSVALGAIVFVSFGAPWLGAKALAIGSPVVLLTALAGCVALASSVGCAGVLRAIVAVGAFALVAAVGWGNVLAYHHVNLAPRSQLSELEHIGHRFAGQGPALMNEYQPYGVRHFLRRLDAEGASELRRRLISLRGGRLAGKGEYVDVDQIQRSALLVYRTLVLRRSPTESRPPASFRLVWRGRWYEVWQHGGTASVLAHVPLGGPLQPAALPPCPRLRRIARIGRLTAPPRPLNLVWPLGSGALPNGWLALQGGAVLPARGGTMTLPIHLQRGGRYRLWLGGSIRGTLRVSVNSKQLGSVSSQLQNAGQWLDLGAVHVHAGGQRISVVVSLPASRPGTGGGGFALGPLLLQPEATSRLLQPAGPQALCRRTVDWLEALAR
jgi:hypothetical protein